MELGDLPGVGDIRSALGVDTGVALAVAAAVLLAAFLVTLLVARVTLGGRRRDTIVILGLSGSGKTTLFYRLRDGTAHGGTVTSMEPNEGRFPLHSEAASKKGGARPVLVHCVDVPGHPRLRPLADDHLPHAAGLVFVVDALDFLPQLRATAEFLYEVLTKWVVASRRLPLLILCNKLDKVTAHTADFIRKQLEKEIDKLRVTRRAISAADVGADVVLGVEGEPFKFAQCRNRVAFAEGSGLADGGQTAVVAFILEQIKG